MDTGVIEVVVHKKTNPAIKVVRIAMIVFTVLFVLAGILLHPIFFVPAVAALAGYFLADRNMDVDYEYVYVEKELRVAVIRNKSRRKQVATFDLDRLEMCAPALSHHLDGFRNRNVTHDCDFSSHEVTVPDNRYFMYLSDGTRIILNLDNEYGQTMVEAIRQFAPRKIFTD